ncbi:MAG TPA: dehydrogenase, partial [Salinimicrobium sp.]|nr:dehydrogenase [Salinimicrobium sp.]
DIFTYRSRTDPNPYQVEHNELFESIRNNGVINNAEYGAQSTMTAILGRMATYSGNVMNWEEAINSDHQIMPAEVTWDTIPPSLPGEDGNYPIPMPGQTKVL